MDEMDGWKKVLRVFPHGWETWVLLHEVNNVVVVVVDKEKKDREPCLCLGLWDMYGVRLWQSSYIF